jgi:hypothetical protein
MLSGVEDVDKEIIKNLRFADHVQLYAVNTSAKKIMDSKDFLVWIADRKSMIPTETFQATISDYKILTNNPLRYIFDKLNNDSVTVSDNVYQSVLIRHDVKETDIFDVTMKEKSLRVVEYLYTHSKDFNELNRRLLKYSMENVSNGTSNNFLDDFRNIDKKIYRHSAKETLVIYDCREKNDEEKFLCQAIIVNPDQYEVVLAFTLTVAFPAQLRISIQALTDEHCWVKMLDHIEKRCNECGFGSDVPRLLNTLYGVAENVGYTNLLRALDERLQ